MEGPICCWEGFEARTTWEHDTNTIKLVNLWLGTSDNLLISIQEKIKWADTMSELDKKHRKEVEDKVEEVKKSVAVKICWSMWLTYVVAEVTHCKQADLDFRGIEEIYSEPGGVMDYEEDRIRPKRCQIEHRSQIQETASISLKIEHETDWMGV
ncbi:COP9 signalosome complex subunit 7-like isoform X2 [Gossypium australe]|uniref:COP9 signalosome complex subunit 7-like isoform X2 n=1 Tax=Gossypium australe TaxID=47621 RepID=A0A5B6UZ62_9ROSI|nr:COP9 signalosome complex subunit 7-like isoform X2 [Gossypium australe]